MRLCKISVRGAQEFFLLQISGHGVLMYVPHCRSRLMNRSNKFHWSSIMTSLSIERIIFIVLVDLDDLAERALRLIS